MFLANKHNLVTGKKTKIKARDRVFFHHIQSGFITLSFFRSNKRLYFSGGDDKFVFGNYSASFVSDMAIMLAELTNLKIRKVVEMSTESLTMYEFY